MIIITYILIGIFFMFTLEFFINSKWVKRYSKKYPRIEADFGFWERTLGIIFWPLCLGVFLYNFFKEYFK